MNHSKIIKYFAGKASEEEVKEIFRWIDETPENKSEFIKLKKAYALTSKSSEAYQPVWNKVIIPLIHRNVKTHQLYTYARYAAIVVLFLGLGILLQKQFNFGVQDEFIYASNTVIDVPLGQMTNLTLSDGTMVQLNSGSHFVYANNYTQGERTVELEGEAFFDVAKDSEHPFIVKTKALDFKVYGTSFNIQAYEDEIDINTTLVEGSLGVLSKAGKEYVRLKPGENVMYNGDSKRLSVKKVDTNQYTSWQKGIITFRNDKLKDIAKHLERWYNVEIVIEDKDLAEELFFGSIMKNKPIDQILEVLKKTSSLNYKIEYRSEKPTLIYWQ